MNFGRCVKARYVCIRRTYHRVYIAGLNLKFQKILNPRYPSFSVLGLALTLGFGVLIITLELVLEPAIRRVNGEDQTDPNNRRSHDVESRPSSQEVDTNQPRLLSPNTKELKHAEWSLNSTLQLQRLAHEAIGAGTWRRTTSDTPITEHNQPLGVIDFKKTSSKHPYLIKPINAAQSEAAADSGTEKDDDSSRNVVVDSNETTVSIDGNEITVSTDQTETPLSAYKIESQTSAEGGKNISMDIEAVPCKNKGGG